MFKTVQNEFLFVHQHLGVYQKLLLQLLRVEVTIQQPLSQREQ